MAGFNPTSNDRTVIDVDLADRYVTKGSEMRKLEDAHKASLKERLPKDTTSSRRKSGEELNSMTKPLNPAVKKLGIASEASSLEKNQNPVNPSPPYKKEGALSPMKSGILTTNKPQKRTPMLNLALKEPRNVSTPLQSNLSVSAITGSSRTSIDKIYFRQ